MRIALLEMDIAWGRPEENILTAERLMKERGAADLYILPEMWATGFAVEPEGMVEDESTSIALSWMKQTARERHCALSGSLAVKVGDDYRNRHYFVTPDAVSFYDKRHLFSYGREHLKYTRGEQAVIVDCKGFRLLLQTCYDLRFPVFSRYGRAGEYDAIIYVANWPEKRQMIWNTLIRARAIENQCFVMAVNRTGQDPVSVYAGGSAIIDPVGNTVNGFSAEISIDVLNQIRNRYRFLDDRD